MLKLLVSYLTFRGANNQLVVDVFERLPAWDIEEEKKSTNNISASAYGTGIQYSFNIIGKYSHLLNK